MTVLPRVASVGLILALLVFTLAVAGPQPAADPPPFADWPKGGPPDAVVVLSGQTYGYLQPCGCRRPQLGGLERRANFLRGLRDRGWPVTAVDLGDVLPAAGVVPEQVLLKYATAMTALREMGYAAVGVGRAEVGNGLFRVLAEYALKKEQPPYTLAGNIGGRSGDRVTPRDEAFPGPGPRPLVGLTEVVAVGGVRVGVVGVIGPSVRKAVEALGPATRVGFTGQTEALDAAGKELAGRREKPDLLVLLYQGTLERRGRS